MPTRCKALVRGGSRRCRRPALRGQSYCGLHAPHENQGGTHSNHRRSTTRSRRATTRTSGRVVGTSVQPKGYYQTIRNPHFGLRDVVSHVVHDKVSDAARSTRIAYGVQAVTAPLVMLGPPGFVARSALTIGLTMNISHAANVFDMGRDLYQFASTGEVHGKRIYAHEYVQ